MSQRFQYTPSFDGLRGIAVLCVLLAHAAPWKYNHMGIIIGISPGLFKGGWVGVDLFFVLSGYLITSLLQNEYYTSGKISFAKFYARRALRLLPPLLICLAMANVLWQFTPHYYHPNRLLATFAGLFYFTNLLLWPVLGLLDHLWSLAVEEHFYVVWPIIGSTFLFRVSPRNGAFFLAITIFLIAALRIFVLHCGDLTYGPFVIHPYSFTPCRMDAILMGSLLAVVLPHKTNVEKRRKVNIDWSLGILLCLLATVVLFVRLNIYWYNGGFIFTNLLCLSIVAIAAINPNQPLLSNNILRWIGRRSYGIYLYHFPIFLALGVLTKEHSPVNYLLVTALRFAATIVVAEVSYRFIERPVLRYKKRYQVASEFVIAQPTG